jgi:hypothetical protein
MADHRVGGTYPVAVIIWTGIDPGLDGAIVSHTSAGDYLVHDTPTLTLESGRRATDIAGLIDHVVGLRPAVIGVEKLQAGGKGTIASFALGVGWCAAWSAAYVSGGQVVDMRPTDWKKHYGLLKRPKDDARLLAIEMLGPVDWLRFKYHVDRAEAFLIGRLAYERRI